MFIARISRGRTIREFVFGVLLAPTIVGSLWFTIFGDTGILRQRNEGDLLDAEGAVNTNTSLFQVLDGLPIAAITSVIAIAVIVFFFVTSSDSGSLVIDILSTGGELETPKITRVYWAVLQGIAAAVLLLVGGTSSLTALQTMSIATAVPFSVVLVLACVSMLKAFRYDVATTPRYVRVTTTSDVAGDEPTVATPAAPRKRATAGISTTFSGLAPSREGLTSSRSDGSVVLAVHEVSTEQLEVHPETGAVEYSGDNAPVDPLGGEVFDTQEFADSAEGQNQNNPG